MHELIEAGVWVEIHRTLLDPGERAPQVPKDTQQVPLELRVKGFLVTPASLGAQAEIETACGRRQCGILTEVNPPYQHGFGAPIPELAAIVSELRGLPEP